MKTLSTVYAEGGFDANKPDNNVIARVTAELTDGSWVVTDEDGSTREATYEELMTIISGQE
jgi:hypothetical protein